MITNVFNRFINRLKSFMWFINRDKKGITIRNNAFLLGLFSLLNLVSAINGSYLGCIIADIAIIIVTYNIVKVIYGIYKLYRNVWLEEIRLNDHGGQLIMAWSEDISFTPDCKRLNYKCTPLSRYGDIKDFHVNPNMIDVSFPSNKCEAGDIIPNIMEVSNNTVFVNIFYVSDDCKLPSVIAQLHIDLKTASISAVANNVSLTDKGIPIIVELAPIVRIKMELIHDYIE